MKKKLSVPKSVTHVAESRRREAFASRGRRGPSVVKMEEEKGGKREKGKEERVNLLILNLHQRKRGETSVEGLTMEKIRCAALKPRTRGSEGQEKVGGGKIAHFQQKKSRHKKREELRHHRLRKNRHVKEGTGKEGRRGERGKATYITYHFWEQGEVSERRLVKKRERTGL